MLRLAKKRVAKDCPSWWKEGERGIHFLLNVLAMESNSWVESNSCIALYKALEQDGQTCLFDFLAYATGGPRQPP